MQLGRSRRSYFNFGGVPTQYKVAFRLDCFTVIQTKLKHIWKWRRIKKTSMKPLYSDHRIFTPDVHTGKNANPSPVRPGSIFFWDEADTRDCRQWFSLTQLLAALHPHVEDVFIAPGALGTMCFSGPSRINGPVGLERSITSTSRWGRPPFHSRIGFFELIHQLPSVAKCLKTSKNEIE